MNEKCPGFYNKQIYNDVKGFKNLPNIFSLFSFSIFEQHQL